METKEKRHDTPWHALSHGDVARLLETRQTGLTAQEAKDRLAAYGPNRLTPPKTRSVWMLLLSQFNNLLIYVLLVASGLTAAFGHVLDAAVILGVVLVNAAIGFVQEGKAEKALDAIKDLLSLKASVIRETGRQTIEAHLLVPGDVVFIESGDKVPADLRMFMVKNLRIAEAALTGESVPTAKSTEPVKETATVGDKNCMAFSGTMVISGQGMGFVAATGDRTEIGRISGLISRTETPTTRLLLKMKEFGKVLTVAIGAVAAATFLFGILVRQYSVTDMFLSAVGLAVAAIPEGLPAILTITLAIGVQRMARRNAIIRRLPSVETLGSVTVICSDKTGTLTRNEMTVKSLATPTHFFEVTGAGYNPQGTLIVEGEELSCYFTHDRRSSCRDYPELQDCVLAGVCCNDASVSETEGEWGIQGDPTEGALVVMAIKAGLDVAAERAEWRRMDTIPFESEHRFMATLHRNNEGKGVVFVKGAPERIMSMCETQRAKGADEPLDARHWKGLVRQIAARAERPLAIAAKAVDPDKKRLTMDDVAGGLTLLGLVGIIDPPRGAAITAIQKCKTAGIRVKMITGDHVLTARAIGEQMGIGDGTTAVTGEELDLINDEDLQETVRNVDVFARVSPEHKLRLVGALQSNGEVVAMTGDGVNDAPALKRADIGVAMGLKGTEAAKEASEMVLADDNFASIEHAVEEGRTVYDNLKKAILFILPTNAGEAFVIIAAILFGRTLPITPVQILWINMITAVTLALALSFEPSEPGVMKRPPRHPNESIFSPFLVWRICFVGAILLVGTFGLFVYERAQGAAIEYARTVAVNTLVMFEVLYLFNTRYLRESVFNLEGIFGNGYVIASIAVVILFQMLLTYGGPLQHLFGTQGIEFGAWIRILLVSASVLVLVELEKLVLRRL